MIPGSARIVAHSLSERLQGPLVRLTRDRHLDHLGPPDHLLDDRFLGLVGKGVDGVDPRLDVVEQLLQVFALEDRHCDHSGVLGRGRADVLDSLEILDRFFDPDHHALLDLLGRGSGVGHPDVDDVD